MNGSKTGHSASRGSDHGMETTLARIGRADKGDRAGTHDNRA
jgi:hypothetical protein